MLPGGGAGLKVELNDFLQRVAQAEDNVGRGCYRGEIDVEELYGGRWRPIEGGQEAVGTLPTHVLQGGIKGHGHGRIPTSLTIRSSASKNTVIAPDFPALNLGMDVPHSQPPLWERTPGNSVSRLARTEFRSLRSQTEFGNEGEGRVLQMGSARWESSAFSPALASAISSGC